MGEGRGDYDPAPGGRRTGGLRGVVREEGYSVGYFGVGLGDGFAELERHDFSWGFGPPDNRSNDMFNYKNKKKYFIQIPF